MNGNPILTATIAAALSLTLRKVSRCCSTLDDKLDVLSHPKPLNLFGLY
jgi:hypothetical protein